MGPAPHRPVPTVVDPRAGWSRRIDIGLYFTPDNPTYDPTIAQVWFKDEQSALRAGFTPWHHSSPK